MEQAQKHDDESKAYVGDLVQKIICQFPSDGVDCPALTEADFEWRLLGENYATEEQIFVTGSQKDKQCRLWDGGVFGLPPVAKELTLGNIKKVGGSQGTHAIQVVYASNGYETVRD